MILKHGDGKVTAIELISVSHQSTHSSNLIVIIKAEEEPVTIDWTSSVRDQRVFRVHFLGHSASLTRTSASSLRGTSLLFLWANNLLRKAASSMAFFLAFFLATASRLRWKEWGCNQTLNLRALDNLLSFLLESSAHDVLSDIVLRESEQLANLVCSLRSQANWRTCDRTLMLDLFSNALFNWARIKSYWNERHVWNLKITYRLVVGKSLDGLRHQPP